MIDRLGKIKQAMRCCLWSLVSILPWGCEAAKDTAHTTHRASTPENTREGAMDTADKKLHALKPVRTPVAILGSLGVCIYVPASPHWLISYSPIHLI